MVARAMANFGLSELRLVNPRDGWPSEKARAAASRADHVIDGGDGLRRSGCGGRRSQFRLRHHRARARRLQAGARTGRGGQGAAGSGNVAGQRTGILFGRERFGLYNDEVGLADEIVTFPVDPAFSSLNIAQAVLLMSYEWMKSGLEDETDTNFSSPEMPPATQGRNCTACSPIWKPRSKRAAISARRRRSRRWSTICAPC